LLAPATILGMPAEAVLNQKNSTSLTLGTQTAFDFNPPKNAGGQAPRCSTHLYPKMLNGAHKNLSNLVFNFVTYLWDKILEVVSKPLLSLLGVGYLIPKIHSDQRFDCYEFYQPGLQGFQVIYDIVNLFLLQMLKRRHFTTTVDDL
jgi:hypothetical protein